MLRPGFRLRLGLKVGLRLWFMLRLGFSGLSNLLCLRFLRFRLSDSIFGEFELGGFVFLEFVF